MDALLPGNRGRYAFQDSDYFRINGLANWFQDADAIDGAGFGNNKIRKYSFFLNLSLAPSGYPRLSDRNFSSAPLPPGNAGGCSTTEKIRLRDDAVCANAEMAETSIKRQVICVQRFKPTWNNFLVLIIIRIVESSITIYHLPNKAALINGADCQDCTQKHVWKVLKWHLSNKRL